MTKVAKQKHATAELEQRAGSRHREVRRRRGGQARRDLRISKTKIRRCQMMRRPYTSTHNHPDGATCWQDRSSLLVTWQRLIRRPATLEWRRTH
jgi:hypothetical protein